MDVGILDELGEKGHLLKGGISWRAAATWRATDFVTARTVKGRLGTRWTMLAAAVGNHGGQGLGARKGERDEHCFVPMSNETTRVSLPSQMSAIAVGGSQTRESTSRVRGGER